MGRGGGGGRVRGRTGRSISTGYVFVALIGFTSVYVFISTRTAALYVSSIPAPAVRSPVGQIHRTSISGGCRSMTQQSSWILHQADRKSSPEITIWHPVTFQNKQSVLTPAHKSQPLKKQVAHACQYPMFLRTVHFQFIYHDITCLLV